MLDQNDFLELALSRDGSEIAKNRIRRLIKHRMTNPAKGQHHKHHIAPTSWHPEHSKNKKNIVRLTHREHFVVHKMMHRAFPKDISMSRAYHLMSAFGVGSCKGTARYASSRQYEESRKWVSIQMTENNPMKRAHVKKKKAAWERANYDFRDSTSMQNFRTNNPMTASHVKEKMVKTRKANGTYNADTGKHLRAFDEQARRRMKSNNPMHDPEIVEAAKAKRMATIKTFDYWKSKYFDPHEKSKQIQEYILNSSDRISHLSLIREFNITRDFAVSIANRFNEQNDVVAAVKGVI